MSQLRGVIGDMNLTGFSPRERVIYATAILVLVRLGSRHARLGSVADG